MSDKEEQQQPLQETFEETPTSSPQPLNEQQPKQEHARQLRPKPKDQMFTPAVIKRNQATKHLVIQSPTDNIFSPISQKLLGRKREAHKEFPDEVPEM